MCSKSELRKGSIFILGNDNKRIESSYKFAHNSSNTQGRNLIKSIKQVVQRNIDTDLSLIPNLLQEVRLNSIKTQLQKQLQETHQIIDSTIKANQPIKLPSNLSLKRRASLDQDQTCRNNDSNRILLLNKNTVLYEEDQVNSLFRNDDQSHWSTPFHPELLQKYKNLRPD